MKRLIKPIKLFFVFLIILSTNQVSVNADSEYPVSEDDTHYEAVAFLSEMGIIDDCVKMRFSSNEKITSSNFIYMTWKALGFDKSMDDIEDVSFDSLPYIPRAACWLPSVVETEKMGYIQLDNYYPKNSIKRAEAFELFFDINGVPVPKYYKDPKLVKDLSVSSKDWPTAQKARELELLNFEQSDDDGFFFNANSDLTYGEAAEIIYRYHFSFFVGNYDINEVIGNSLDSNDAYPIFEDVYKRIHSDFLPTGDADIDDKKMIYDATRAMVESLGDPYTNFFSPSESESFLSQIEGKFEGVGMYIEEAEGYIRVISPLPGSPAEEAGIKPKDLILEVDGVSTEGKTVQEAVNLIKGDEGTKVKLKINRSGKVMNIEITRKLIELKSVYWEKNGDIAVIQINQEIDTTYQEFKEISKEILDWKKDPKGIILDLRNNPGGLLNTAVLISGFFVEKGSVVAMSEGKEGIDKVYKTKSDPIFGDVPIVIIVNEGSASAAEIIAGCLQENGAKVVGVNSFGKGTAQSLVQYIDGSMLKITIAKWLTPSGKWIQGDGIVPDYEVKNKEDFSRDYQLEKALKLFK